MHFVNNKFTLYAVVDRLVLHDYLFCCFIDICMFACILVKTVSLMFKGVLIYRFYTYDQYFIF